MEIGGVVAGKYRLVREIATGGMGVVFEAVHEVTLRRVAIKIIHSWIVDGSTASGARFLREARAAAAIEHPAIVEVLDAGSIEDGSLYLVFELLEGEELQHALARGGMATSEVLEIGVAVLDGLSAAHQSGFIHRDVKPANVFLAKRRGGKREVKLLDFGISKHASLGAASVHSVTQQGAVVGTLDYMAPEQALGLTIDARADLWSVGAMLFQALAGVPLFSAPKDFELIEKIVRGPMPALETFRPDLSSSLIKVIERALERDLAKRWPSAAQMRDALLAVDEARVEARAPQRRFISSGPTELIETAPRNPSSDGDRTVLTPFQDLPTPIQFADEPTPTALDPPPPMEIPESEISDPDAEGLPRVIRPRAISQVLLRAIAPQAPVPAPAPPQVVPKPISAISIFLLALALALAVGAYLAIAWAR